MTTQKSIRYTGDYKYQLAESYMMNISIMPKSDIETDFTHLNMQGDLLIKEGYAWDGPSGFVKDTEENMRASLVHDALYQLMRNQHINAKTHRKAADKLFQNMCKDDGMSRFRAFFYFTVLRQFGRPAASPQRKKRVQIAPKI